MRMYYGWTSWAWYFKLPVLLCPSEHVPLLSPYRQFFPFQISHTITASPSCLALLWPLPHSHSSINICRCLKGIFFFKVFSDVIKRRALHSRPSDRCIWLVAMTGEKTARAEALSTACETSSHTKLLSGLVEMTRWAIQGLPWAVGGSCQAYSLFPLSCHWRFGTCWQFHGCHCVWTSNSWV